MNWKEYRKLIGPLVVAVYAVARAFGIETYIVEEEAIAQITTLFDALVPILGVVLVYVLPNGEAKE